MIFVRELELWGMPGKLYDLDEVDCIVETIRTELCLPKATLMPHHWVADDVNVDILKRALSSGEVGIGAFFDFCKRFNLKPDPMDPVAACSFIDFVYGQKLAWLHLPAEDDNITVLSNIASTARLRSVILIDPDWLVCLVFPQTGTVAC